MEAAPPTYLEATKTDYFSIVARYIPSNDLCSASLVCSTWHTAFAPHLWGNPASHFGIENDRVYVALTKFKRTLRIARLLVRSLTHTLHLPPAHAEIYNGPHADWLRDILERLPHLQSLVVRGLPFFDYAALQALKYKPAKLNDQNAISPGLVELPASSGLASRRPTDLVPSFELRLLDASRCPNVTSTSLAQALGRFEALLYLDLSFTYPARDSVVLSELRRFPGLQVLKLRGVGLSDEPLGVLCQAIGRKVRSLDIRDNRISDRGIGALLNKCLFASGWQNVFSNMPQRSPGLLPYMGAAMLETYQSEHFESFLRNALTGGFVSRLAFEDAPEGGITHLYVSGNELTVEGVSDLVKSERLHVLDIQSLAGAKQRKISTTPHDGSELRLGLPGVEKLTHVLANHAGVAMRFLRVDHSLITKDALNVIPEQLLHGRAELDDTARSTLPRYAAEIDGVSVQHEAFEMPGVQTPRYELPADPMQFVVSPARNNQQRHPEEASPQGSYIKRGSVFAPEAVDMLVPETDRMNLLSPVSALEEPTSTNRSSRPDSPTTESAPSPLSMAHTLMAYHRPRSYSTVADERKARLDVHMASRHSLHPAMLPRLRTLVLTDVPPVSSSQEVADRLICFIKQCAEETWLAKSQARLDYALPPGRSGHAATLKQCADRLFALKHLVLELAPEQNILSDRTARTWQSSAARSVTEDRDSEVLWSAAETDFSFFGDEDSSFPSLDSGRYAHSSLCNEKEASFQSRSGPRNIGSKAKQSSHPRFDTVALLSNFRKERKQAHHRSISAGAIDPETQGYWEGIVQVVRPGSGLRGDEQMDYYGNRFQNAYLYR
ncbi:hypothetical protein LTR37_020693 [Vermiconidia calcicola]|uniref:Uncharacterized protein n=1 Tax=Vermiconidia calcicola TaxID=1690605 RepID=A0ACC3MAP5_9PEZI|nr:hypothetical protein LTR37_020693 [Vermiconidia calcicola]